MVLPLPGGGARGPRASLTWLFYHIQDGLSTGVFIVLESDDTVILILVGAIHCILAGVLWKRGEHERMKKISQFLKDGVISEHHSWNFCEIMQQKTLHLTLGKVPRFEVAVVPGNCLQLTLTDVLCPSPPLFGSYSFLRKEHDIIVLHNLIQSLALPRTSCVTLGKLLDLMNSSFFINKRKMILSPHRDG